MLKLSLLLSLLLSLIIVIFFIDRWFNFEKVVQALNGNNTFYLNVKDLQVIVKEVCFVKDETELGVMLDFYHDLGMVVKHGSTVVLQAQWLIDLFKQLITILRFEEVVRNVSFFSPLNEVQSHLS